MILPMPLPAIIIPLITIFLAQILKLATDRVKGNLTLRHILSDYSGMPSSHSALVASLATTVGFISGISSPEFGIAAIFALIIIRDALGFRRYLGEYAKRINALSPEEFPLPTRVGHRPREVYAGTLLGIGVSTLCMSLF